MWAAYLSWEADFTAPQMVLTIKLTSYAFSCHDGHLLSTAGASSGLSAREKQMAITEQPSLLAYYGWVFFGPGMLAGPATEFAEYRSYVDRSMFASTAGRVPFSVLAVLRPLLAAVVAVAVFTLLPTLGSSRVYEIFVAEPERYAEWNAFVLFAFAILLGSVTRTRYHFVWKLGEACANIAGIGYEGDRWGRMCNVDPVHVEFATSIKSVLDAWNIRTQTWLRYYVFERIAATRFAEWKMPLTFLTSAFWHGLYPGYYMGFLSLATSRWVSQNARRKIRPRVLALPRWMAPQLVYDIITWALMHVMLMNSAGPFLLLSFQSSIAFWWRTRFVGFLPLVAGIVVLPLIPSCRSAEHGKPREKKDQ
eukprot:m51a1_g13637 hypothetical protein (364) ;mRNA; f:451-1733